jgi:hypothetical protein
MALQVYKEVILDEFNLILGNNEAKKDQSAQFWEKLQQRLERQFIDFPTNEELSREKKDTSSLVGFSLFSGVCPTSKIENELLVMLAYECNTCGITHPQVTTGKTLLNMANITLYFLKHFLFFAD